MVRVNFSNEKGGVGKTTLSVTCAAGLASRGHRVLLVDTDAQGHATRAVGVPKYAGLYDLLVRDADWKDSLKAVVPAFWGVEPREGGAYAEGDYRLWVLGSNTETANIANSISEAWKLADRLDEVGELFDYVIIDTAPTPSLLHGVIHLASDYMVYPTQAEYFSLDGLLNSLTHRKKFAQLKDVPVGGIVPTMVRANTWEHKQMLRQVTKEYKDLMWPEVAESIVWAEASRAARAVFAYRPDHQAAAQALALVDRVEALK